MERSIHVSARSRPRSVLTRLRQLLPMVAGALAAGLMLAACDPGPPPGSRGESRGTLVLGLLPDEDPARQSARYASLMEAIEGRTGLEVQLVMPHDYENLVSRFVAGEVDLAYFGGYTFLLASEGGGAVPLVMRDIDARFVSHVFVHRDSPIRDLPGLRGSRFSFGARSSTSGHLMPRYHLSARGLVPEDFFSEIGYSDTHDRTVQLVADGTVDAGVANGQIVRSLLEAGSRSEEQAGKAPVRVIWQSPPYVNYVWAVQPSMTEKTRRAIAEVFLSLSMDAESDRRFLDAVGARYFLPAAESDFEELRIAVQELRKHTRRDHGS